jgi:hypothetical protein
MDRKPTSNTQHILLWVWSKLELIFLIDKFNNAVKAAFNATAILCTHLSPVLQFVKDGLTFWIEQVTLPYLLLVVSSTVRGSYLL